MRRDHVDFPGSTAMRHSRILVVDDFEAFRRFLCLRLEEMTHCEVIGEASDGLEAVHKAETLRPDLILLDVGLPTLNGLEVGRRILMLSPASKILFISQDSSFELVQAALASGAHGYLLKSDAAELPHAISAVLEGGVFVSRRLKRSS
jgi:DNA-binding NarL/FixJ family response regulator